MDIKTQDTIIILSTYPDKSGAQMLARGIIAEKLAACVSVLPEVKSYFHWLGKVDETEEHLLLIKTSQKKYRDLEKYIICKHPYELPEIISLPMTGFAPYLKWVIKSTD